MNRKWQRRAYSFVTQEVFQECSLILTAKLCCCCCSLNTNTLCKEKQRKASTDVAFRAFYAAADLPSRRFFPPSSFVCRVLEGQKQTNTTEAVDSIVPPTRTQLLTQRPAALQRPFFSIALFLPRKAFVFLFLCCAGGHSREMNSVFLQENTKRKNKAGD